MWPIQRDCRFDDYGGVEASLGRDEWRDVRQPDGEKALSWPHPLQDSILD